MNPSSPSKAFTTFLVFISCSLLLLVTNYSSHNRSPKTTAETAVEPISFIASRLSAIAMAYLSYMAYHGDKFSHSKLLARMHKSWKQPAVTMMYIELLNTASASLLLMLASVARAANGVAYEAAVIAGAVWLISWLWPVLFSHSEVAYKVGLIVSMTEGFEGEEALERAGELVKDRKVVGFSLMVLTLVVEQATFKVRDMGSAASLVALLAKFFTYYKIPSLLSLGLESKPFGPRGSRPKRDYDGTGGDVTAHPLKRR
ncbi:hypothetical protein HPP92_011335 [Vanilla planifolia]|uniref:Uncharacterized protein n=1 Tax=Vanilla planifolia TaxID=51239 RepID=A0A835V4X6_VANPL|nr:hypothetical protein HPP92_011335 [Vanilla planifolia]